MSTAITKDGQTTIIANLPMGGFRHTGVGNGVARSDYASLGQAQDQAGVFVAAASVGGTADAITLTPSPAITAYAAGQRFSFVAEATNTTAVTVATSGLTARAVTKFGATALVAGDITTGDIVTIHDDGTRYQLLSSVRTPVLTNLAVPVTKLAVGTAGQVLAVNAGATAAEWADQATLITSAGASGAETFFDFTGIPAWVKKITVMFTSASTSGTDNINILLGDAGGFEPTGYLGTVLNASDTTTAASNFTASFAVTQNNAAGNVWHGSVTLTLLAPLSNLWVAEGGLARSDFDVTSMIRGSKALSGALTQVRVSTTIGTDVFDSGTFAVLLQ